MMDYKVREMNEFVSLGTPSRMVTIERWFNMMMLFKGNHMVINYFEEK